MSESDHDSFDAHIDPPAMTSPHTTGITFADISPSTNSIGGDFDDNSSLKRKRTDLDDNEADGERPDQAHRLFISDDTSSSTLASDKGKERADLGEAVPSTSKPYARKVRDRDFYLPDGNVVLLVFDTYFKVHQSRLAQDGSIFSTMFTLPQTDQSQVDGTSESRPIHFIDKPRRFASLLWALYALPAELRSISDSPENVTKLIDIAKAAQRYAFKSTETWALTCLVDIVKSGFRISKKGINPWHIFALASLCNSDELRKAMITKIKDSAAGGKVAYPWVVLIADALGIQELQGEAYYKLVIRGHEGWTELEEPVVRRLYIGFCKLVTFKDQLFADPIQIINHECTGPGPCRARWAVQWKESQAPDPTQPAVPSVDVVGQLKACAANLRRNRVYPGPCHDAWLATIEAKAKELEDGVRLYQFFTT